MSREEFSLKVQEVVPGEDSREYDQGEGVAIQLFTSGTTAAPKAAILRHSNLIGYILGTVEFVQGGDGFSLGEFVTLLCGGREVNAVVRAHGRLLPVCAESR